MHIGGTSLRALRFMPAIAGTALVVLAAFLAREIGARKFGIRFASMATACIGVSFVMDYLPTMNAFEPLFWKVVPTSWCALSIIRGTRSCGYGLACCLGSTAKRRPLREGFGGFPVLQANAATSQPPLHSSSRSMRTVSSCVPMRRTMAEFEELPG
jgi:hypothetical protein